MKKLFLLLILVLFVPILFLTFKTDANVYAYIGRLIVDGGVPYIDAWDHKGISLYLINAIGYGIFGFKSLIGIRILELVLILYAFFRFFQFSKTKYSPLIAFIAGAFGLFTFKYFFDGGNLTEEYGAIFSLLSVLLLLKKNTRTIDYALIGAFFIINFTIRANLIAFWIALFLVYLVRLIINQNNAKEIGLKFLKMTYGGLFMIVSLGAYLWITGSLKAFIDAAFVFNFSYAGGSETSVFTTIWIVMKTYHLSIIMVLGWIIALMRFRKDKSRFLELLLVFWIPLELYLGNLSNRRYGHYYMMWMPLIMFSVLITASEIKARWNPSSTKIMIGSILMFALCYYIPTYLSLMEWKQVITKSKNERQEKQISHLKNEYSTHTILVWGNDCYLYNRSDRFAPVSQFYQTIFKYNTELVRDKMQKFTKQIKVNKPNLIIDTNRRGFIRLDGDNIKEVDKSQSDGLRDFLMLIKDQYQLKEEKLGLSFYELKEDE
jgi:hypothetical protein